MKMSCRHEAGEDSSEPSSRRSSTPSFLDFSLEDVLACTTGSAQRQHEDVLLGGGPNFDVTRRDPRRQYWGVNHRYVHLTKVAEQPGYEWATERLLRRLVYERRIPYSKPASRVLIDLDDLDQLLERSRVESVGA